MHAKEDRLHAGKNALKDMACVDRVSNEGGDGSPGGEWHEDYRVWPTEGHTTDDVADACERHDGIGYVLAPSPTEKEYIYVTVRTT